MAATLSDVARCNGASNPTGQPETTPPAPESIPVELIALPQWVCWRYEERGGKTTKAPIDAKSNGRLTYAKSNDPATWASHADALKACERHTELAGVGFCFAPDDGLTGIDLDHVIDPATGELKPEAAEILERFDGTYIEVSPSGTGLRLFCYGKPGRSGKNVGKAKWLEVYSHPSSRYLTVTGNHWTGSATAVTEQQGALDWLNERFMVSTGQEPVASKPGPSVALTLDDAALLDKARNAKNGAEFAALWAGDTSGHGSDDSAADLALCSLLAFWTGGDADRIDRLFRQSGLMRPKWDSKRGESGTYGSMTVDKAIAGCRDTYSGRAGVRSEATAHTLKPTAPPPVAAVPDSESGAFTRHDPRLMRKSGSSELLKNLSNAITIVENAYPGLVGYNEFRQRIEARFPTKWRKGAGAWTEYDTAELADSIAHRGFPSFNMELLSNAVMTVAHRNPFNPAQDKLRALAAQWDGAERLTTWLVDYLNAGRSAANADYLREIGAAWLKGVAARVLFPGCKRDDVLVLRGPQGWLKSTAANCIAECIHPDSFTDNLGDLSSKDSRAGIRGMIIAELAELAALNKSDIESVKAFVAGRNDHFREAYGRGERDYPRTVSFIGTTNDPTFLKDPSGNRRWWPITITAPIDIKQLDSVLSQLLGEAASRVLAGEAWHVKDELALAQANDVRAAHYADDVWTDAVLNAAKSLLRDKPPQSQYVTVAELMGVMGLRIEQQTVPAQMRIGGILRVNQFESKRKRIDGRLVWVWVQSIPPLVGGYTRGIQQTPSETADVLPYPPVSPTLEHFVENDRSGGREDTAEPPNLGIYRNMGVHGGSGGTPSEIAGLGRIPLPVSPTKGGNSKPVDTPPCTDISADIPIAPPAETTSATTTCKAKTPDIPSDNPAPPASPADPLAARIAELVAEGWSPWNAQARARSEAMHQAKPGARP